MMVMIHILYNIHRYCLEKNSWKLQYRENIWWNYIIQLHCSGRTNKENNKLLKVAKFMVCHVVNKFKELGTFEDRPRSERPRIARTKKVIKDVRERERSNPKRSVRQMAKDMMVSLASMRTILKNVLQLSPYKIRERQYFTHT